MTRVLIINSFIIDWVWFGVYHLPVIIDLSGKWPIVSDCGLAECETWIQTFIVKFSQPFITKGHYDCLQFLISKEQSPEVLISVYVCTVYVCREVLYLYYVCTTPILHNLCMCTGYTAQLLCLHSIKTYVMYIYISTEASFCTFM